MKRLSILAAALAIAATARAQKAPPLIVPRAIVAPNPSLPAEFKRAHAGETVRGAYRICIGTDGGIDSVVATESIPDADESIIDHIKTRWRYERTPVRICQARRFVFKIN